MFGTKQPTKVLLFFDICKKNRQTEVIFIV